MITFDKVCQDIETALATAKRYSDQKPSREMSLVITKLQEAQLWMDVVEHLETKKVT